MHKTSYDRNVYNRLSYHYLLIGFGSEDKIEELILENFYPNVPAFVGNATKQQMLKIAGIHHKNCKGVISLFEDDMTNSQIATICNILNKKIDIIVKASSPQQVEHFKSLNLNNVQNPFDIISKRIFYGITAPHIWLLEMWMLPPKVLELMASSIVNCW